jgi:hypothetical protein
MSDPTQYNKAFTRAQLRAGHDLRRNAQFSVSARLIGLEILSCVNKISGCAFPSEETIARRLGITERSVRTGIKQLKAAGWHKVMRHGRSNMYFPNFFDRIEEIISGIDKAAVEKAAEPPTAENFDANTGKKQHATPEKNDPLTLSSNPVRTLASEVAGDEARKAVEKKRCPQRDKLKARQEAENKIADVIGWPCVQEIPREAFEDLCCRWQRGEVDLAELVELERKYKPTAAAAGRNADGGA